MEREELLQHAQERYNDIDFLYNLCEKISLNDENSDYYKNILITRNYLYQILSDLGENILPYTYNQKIYHNINALQIENLFQRQNLRIEDTTRINSDLLKNTLINSLLKNSLGFLITYRFYKDLGFFSDNIVVVGANGSGKSTLASTLKETIDERDGIVIPAQKLLIVPTFDNTPNHTNSTKEYNEFQKDYVDGKTTYNASKSDDLPWNETQKYGREYKIVLKSLLAERGYVRNIFCNKSLKNEKTNKTDLYSKLDKAIDIWNSLIKHRIMFCDESDQIQLKTIDPERVYPAHLMSDGEKIILYLIGRVLLAPQNALIVIDEPEMYLHKAIVNKLWDLLETERIDCLFVYLTHDLDFAATRKANKYWIQSFNYPISWNLEIIPENDIPESILMKLLGSRKKILFCEGKKNSLDKQIFEVLFTEYTIVPLESCKDVISYTRAFNQIPNKNSEAFGIIDRDFRSDDQIIKLEKENVYSYSAAEIENLFLIEEFIIEYAKYKNEENKIEQIKFKVIELFDRNKVIQISNFVSSYINYCFTESHVKKGNTKQEVISNFQIFTNEIKIENWYIERETLLNKVINEKDYKKIVLLYNNKGLHSTIEHIYDLKSNTYRNKALAFLNQSEDAKCILRSIHPTNPILFQ